MTTTGKAPGTGPHGQAGFDGGTADLGPQARERLSALLDGELDEADTREACRGWQRDAGCRQDWHAWHVIGDVLRSDDLAVGAADDAAFLTRLRTSLDREPVVLAPVALPTRAATRRRSRWLMPGAAAAGFVLVAGTFVALQGGAPDGAAGLRAAGSAGPATVTPTTTATPGPVLASTAPTPSRSAEPATTGRLVRDARLDRYLSAHKQFAGSTMPGWSSGNLRNATVQVEGR